MSTELPHSARLAWTVTSWLRGLTSADDVLDELGDPDLPLRIVDEEGAELQTSDLLVRLRRTGAAGAGVALPVEGDPAGLGGPPAFNLAALEAGEAVVVDDVALVPALEGRVLVWTLHRAARRQLVDVGEADRVLRRSVLLTADRLAELDVARWRPEVADELVHLLNPVPLEAPPGIPAPCAALAARALQATAVVALATVDDGGAVSASQARARRDALSPLGAAARHALVAACSYEVWPPDAPDAARPR